ncbi:MAG: UDP-N-acetylglucosamine 2-epimerase (non-hydrolyzing) [Thermoanaerobaculia bacterium]
MSRIKVVTILGTRPEIIRLSRVIAALDRYTDHVLVHTGQNYDYELNEIFFEQLAIRKPDVSLRVDTSSLGSVLGGVLIGIEPVLDEQKPDAVLILGDTNSSIAGVMAKRMKIPLYHMEAGNRSFDPNVPEEVNRRLIDRISDFNLVYTEHSRRHLLSEGIPHRRIHLTGSPMKEVLEYYRVGIESSDVLRSISLRSGEYVLASMHREENVDSRQDLELLLQALDKVHEQFGMPVIVSMHPRTRRRLDEAGHRLEHEGIRFAKPFGYLDYNALQKNAFCVLSDSGTITEESSLLGFPAITMRRSMERPEGLDTGSIVLTGLDPDVIVQSVAAVTDQWRRGMRPPVPVDYQIANVSQRVVNLILGTARLSNAWDGVRKHD